MATQRRLATVAVSARTCVRTNSNIFVERKRILLYYFQSAKSNVAKLYWSGRLDELKRLRKILKNSA